MKKGFTMHRHVRVDTLAIACAPILLVGCLACLGCGRGDVGAAVSDPHAPSAQARADGVDSLKVYGQVPAFQLTDQAGTDFDSETLAGKVWVANFFFTQCPSTCPRQSLEIRKLHDSKWARAGDVKFLSISVQPEVDTPEVLERYAQQFDADPERWHFLTGARDDIWRLSKTGFYLPVEDTPPEQEVPILHSPMLILVDRAMRIRGFFDSQSLAGVGELRDGIRTLLDDESSNEFVAEQQQAEKPDLSDLENDLEGAFAKQPGEATENAKVIYAPSRSRVLAPWMLDRAERQRDTREQFEVFYDFRFSDQLPGSGIDFVNRVVEDAGKKYTAAHYDHGNGVAIADIDGDGLYDLYFTNQIGANGLFRNLGGGKFQNITKSANVGLADRISVTASFADIDNDGDPDLFVTTVRHGNACFRNEGGGKFTDVTSRLGLEYKGHSSSAVFFDYDRDGWLDLFLTNVGRYTKDEVGVGNYYRSRENAFAGHLLPELSETCLLYRNVDGKRFEDVTKQVKLVDDSWSGAASPIDANGDGWLDLYVLDMQGPDEYFENIQGKYFEKKTQEVFPTTSWGAMGIKVFDFDNDGRLDLYITDMHSDMSERVGVDGEKKKANMQWPESMLRTNGNSIWGNALFQKQADGSYQEVSDKFNAENYWPWGLSVGDLNADGFEDVFIASSMNLPFRYGVNSVLLNNQGKRFLDSEFILGVEPRREGRTGQPWFTLDCDGPDREHAYAKEHGIKSGKVVVWGALGSRSSVIFDYDGDGDLDIITNDFHSEPLVLSSNLSDRQQIRYLKVKLVGSQSNRDGLGAVVTLRAGKNTYTKVHDGQSGYLSQSSQLLYFGLGEASQVDSIAVTWPSGKQQLVEKVGPINRVLTIEEPR